MTIFRNFFDSTVSIISRSRLQRCQWRRLAWLRGLKNFATLALYLVYSELLCHPIVYSFKILNDRLFLLFLSIMLTEERGRFSYFFPIKWSLKTVQCVISKIKLAWKETYLPKKCRWFLIYYFFRNNAQNRTPHCWDF